MIVEECMDFVSESIGFTHLVCYAWSAAIRQQPPMILARAQLTHQTRVALPIMTSICLPVHDCHGHEGRVLPDWFAGPSHTARQWLKSVVKWMTSHKGHTVVRLSTRAARAGYSLFQLKLFIIVHMLLACRGPSFTTSGSIFVHSRRQRLIVRHPHPELQAQLLCIRIQVQVGSTREHGPSCRPSRTALRNTACKPIDFQGYGISRIPWP